jgi:hypothetical protein
LERVPAASAHGERRVFDAEINPQVQVRISDKILKYNQFKGKGSTQE